jgi:hypothetical protein
MDLLRVLARAPRGSLKPMLVWIATDSTLTSTSPCELTVSCRAGSGRARPCSPAARRPTACANQGSLSRDTTGPRPPRTRPKRLAGARPEALPLASVCKAAATGLCASVHATEQRRGDLAASMARVLHLAYHDVTFVPGRERHSRSSRPTSAADRRMRLALRVSIIAWGSAPRRDRTSVAVGPGAEVLLAGSARNP